MVSELDLSSRSASTDFAEWTLLAQSEPKGEVWIEDQNYLLQFHIPPMKDQTFNSEETEFLAAIQEFFGTRTVINHLTFIDKWMELLLGGKRQKRWTKPADLYYFYERIEKLFEASYYRPSPDLVPRPPSPSSWEKDLKAQFKGELQCLKQKSRNSKQNCQLFSVSVESFSQGLGEGARRAGEGARRAGEGPIRFLKKRNATRMVALLSCPLLLTLNTK
ncbi:hypothetical protein EON80_21070 [bacterium]|nr:MAG: hypothetical protein EON80_21070 [bacterium]